MIFILSAFKTYARPVKLKFRDREEAVLVSETALLENIDPDGLLALILKKNAHAEIIRVPSRGDLFQRYLVYIIEKGKDVYLDSNLIPALLEECELLGLPQVWQYIDHYDKIEKHNAEYQDSLDPKNPEITIKEDFQAICYPPKIRTQAELEKIVDTIRKDDDKKLVKIITKHQINPENTFIPMQYSPDLKITLSYKLDGTQGTTMSAIAVMMGSLKCIKILFHLGADMENYSSNYGTLTKGRMENASSNIKAETLELLGKLKHTPKVAPKTQKAMPKKLRLDTDRLYRLLDMNPELIPEMIQKQIEALKEQNIFEEKRRSQILKRLKEEEEQLAILTEKNSAEIKKAADCELIKKIEGSIIFHPLQGIDKAHALYERANALIKSAAALASSYPIDGEQPHVEIVPSVIIVFEDGNRFKFVMGARVLATINDQRIEKRILVDGLKAEGKWGPIKRRKSCSQKLEPMRALSTEIAAVINEFKKIGEPF